MTRVALLFGGLSGEHSISCVSAAGVLAAIDRNRFEVVPIGITREGLWTLQPDNFEPYRLGQELPEVIDNGTRVALPERVGARTLRITRPETALPQNLEVDIVFPLLHGKYGEDGTVQGMLEMCGVPYVGNGVLTSALSMDKHMTKTLLAAAGIAVAPWVAFTKDLWQARRTEYLQRIAALGLPIFVKPSRAGSSLGVSRVTGVSELQGALERAFAEDDTVLVEQAILGREIECAVLAGRTGEKPRVSVAGEIVLSGRDFYDFAAKYQDAGSTGLICPAELADTELGEVQNLAAQVFRLIGGRGLARIDFFFTGERFVVNEVNTMPGFTPISMFPRCWAESGLGYTELITELIELGLRSGR